MPNYISVFYLCNCTNRNRQETIQLVIRKFGNKRQSRILYRLPQLYPFYWTCFAHFSNNLFSECLLLEWNGERKEWFKKQKMYFCPLKPSFQSYSIFDTFLFDIYSTRGRRGMDERMKNLWIWEGNKRGEWNNVLIK